MSDRDEIELNRFWNALGETGAAADGELDPASAELLQRMHALANAPLPVSARERVWRGLLDTYISIPENKERTMLTAVDSGYPGMTNHNGLALPIRPRDVPGRQRSRLDGPVTYAAIAAVLLVIIAGFAAARFIDRGDSDSSRGGPAIFAPASPSPETEQTDETLVDITLPADVIPIGDIGSLMLSYDTIPANSESVRQAGEGECCPGTKIYYIRAGSVSVVGDGLMQVIRHDQRTAIEDVAPGTNVDLSPGDALIVRNEHGNQWATTHEPVDVVSAVLVSGPTGPFNPHEWEGHGYAQEDHTLRLPEGPYILRLQDITAVPDQPVALPENGLVQLGLMESGDSVGRGSDGSLSVVGDAAGEMFVLSLLTAGDGRGTPIAGMNASAPQASATP